LENPAGDKVRSDPTQLREHAGWIGQRINVIDWKGITLNLERYTPRASVRMWNHLRVIFQAGELRIMKDQADVARIIDMKQAKVNLS